jgi:FlaG/FlaF family flagellin (archaellin)
MNKKGVSMIIGYVLLIVVSIVMSVLVYNWIKTYVPSESPQCDEGASLFIQEIDYDCDNSILNITLKNNGKFSIHGFYIRVSNKTEDELPAIDISQNVIKGGVISINAVVFSENIENSLTPQEGKNVIAVSFNVSNLGQLSKLDIIPIRVQEINNKKRRVSCSNAIIRENLECGVGS